MAPGRAALASRLTRSNALGALSHLLPLAHNVAMHAAEEGTVVTGNNR